MCKEGRWFTGDEDGRDARRLREAIVVATCETPANHSVGQSSRTRLRGLANSILDRLKQVSEKPAS